MVKNSNRHYLTYCTTVFYKESDGSAYFYKFFSENFLYCRAHHIDGIWNNCEIAVLSTGLAVPVSGYSCPSAGLAVFWQPNKYPTSIPQVRSMIMAIGEVKWLLYCFPNLFAKILRYSISFCNIVLSKMLSLGIASPYSSL